MINYKVFETAEAVVTELSEQLVTYSQRDKPMHISLSGGSTPKLWFKLLAKDYATKVNWNNLHFWWGDERCVEPTDPESNYGEAKALLFDHIDIDAQNIHRILGENDPDDETQRLAEEICAKVPSVNGIPSFDWILLGMGGDGHTASLFPYKTDFNEPNLTLVAEHPESGQLRISKSARLLSNASRITYLVLGESKAQRLYEIATHDAADLPYPAAKIKALKTTEWYLDASAAKDL
ncbi:6-phosphogluconolactonase [Celerinatantimonas yamalensis]|uniref:6-phosphogluconolactonase n=1 Tax=Celerinatantimonas yamalensis TaxID=559956 RepID=A0ABW9G810_9GAMM